MSHIVTIETQVRDPIAIHGACRRLQLAPPVLGTHRLFAATAQGWAVHLPEWRYPVVCHPESGRLSYDNFKGQWGDAKQLEQFIQAYAVEKTRIEARKQGHSVTEQALPDGSIKLTVQVGGAA